MVDHEPGAGHVQFDADVEEFSPFVVAVRRLYNYATTCDAVEKRIKPAGFLLDARCHRVG